MEKFEINTKNVIETNNTNLNNLDDLELKHLKYHIVMCAKLFATSELTSCKEAEIYTD